MFHRYYSTAFGEVEVMGMILDDCTVVQGTFNDRTRFAHNVEIRKGMYYFYDKFNEHDMVIELIEEHLRTLTYDDVVKINKYLK